MPNTTNFLHLARRTIAMERDAIQNLLEHIDENFSLACKQLLSCKGRVVVVGMGKSGHIGNKIAATLASTGTPAFFVHPAEASHGDMGMITQDDIVLALSNSGSTGEIVTLLPLIKRLGIPLISMTSNASSPLAQAADVHLDTRVTLEACPLNLAPTSSTTVSLVLGDALAIALLEARGFTAEDFAFSHPGGALGRRLLLKVENIMHTGEQLPVVPCGTSLLAALPEMTRKGLGILIVQHINGDMAGIFTDGDLRRALDRGIDVRETQIDSLMTCNAKSVRPEMLAAEALKIMEDHKINAVAVLDAQRNIIGALNMHDLLRAGVM